MKCCVFGVKFPLGCYQLMRLNQQKTSAATATHCFRVEEQHWLNYGHHLLRFRCCCCCCESSRKFGLSSDVMRRHGKGSRRQLNEQQFFGVFFLPQLFFVFYVFAIACGVEHATILLQDCFQQPFLPGALVGFSTFLRHLELLELCRVLF